MSTELIERLRAAEGGSWELDAEIAELVGYTVVWRNEGGLAYWHDPAGRYIGVMVPGFTRSLDAALTLVPEGLQHGYATHPTDEVFNPGGAQAYVTDGLENGAYAHADAATPALALVIAALTAREQSQ